MSQAEISYPSSDSDKNWCGHTIRLLKPVNDFLKIFGPKYPETKMGGWVYGDSRQTPPPHINNDLTLIFACLRPWESGIVSGSLFCIYEYLFPELTQ